MLIADSSHALLLHVTETGMEGERALQRQAAAAAWSLLPALAAPSTTAASASTGTSNALAAASSPSSFNFHSNSTASSMNLGERCETESRQQSLLSLLAVGCCLLPAACCLGHTLPCCIAIARAHVV